MGNCNSDGKLSKQTLLSFKKLKKNESEETYNVQNVEAGAHDNQPSSSHTFELKGKALLNHGCVRFTSTKVNRLNRG